MNSFDVNIMPDGWEEKKLKEYLNIQNGFAFNSKKFNDNEKGTPLIRIRNLKKFNITTYYDGDYDDKYIVTKGDFLIGMDGEFRCYEWNNENALLNQRVCKITDVNEKLDSKFLFYGINKFLTDIEAVTAFVTVKHISASQIKEINFPIPPLEEQKRIVAKIDNLFAKIDKAISLTETSLVQAKNLLPSAVKKIFEDGETKGWKKLKFKEFASLRHGHQFRKYDYVENGIPVVKIGQCKTGNRLDLTKCNFIEKSRKLEFSNDLICKGDLLMALTGGTLGKVTWVKDDYGVVVQNYRVGNFFTDEKLSSKRFLMYALLSPIFQTLMYSKINVAAQPNIGKEEIENLEFILPSLEEQSKIVDRLDDVTFKTKETQSKLEEQLAYLKQLKSSILSKAFKGEL